MKMICALKILSINLQYGFLNLGTKSVCTVCGFKGWALVSCDNCCENVTTLANTILLVSLML